MKLSEFNSQTIDRIIEMAWEDRTPFDTKSCLDILLKS